MKFDDILKRLNELYDEGVIVKQSAYKKYYEGVIDLTPIQVDNGKFFKW